MPKSAFNLQIAEICELPQKFRLWKAHWLGGLSLNLTTHEPLIDVYVVPVVNPELVWQDSLGLTFNSSYDFKELRVIQIGVGSLPLVGIGTVFDEGFPTLPPSYLTKVFEFTPTPANQRIIRPGEVRYEDDYWTCYYVPSWQHHIFKSRPELADSWLGDVLDVNERLAKTINGKCLFVDLAENERLPGSEKEFAPYAAPWSNDPEPPFHNGELVDGNFEISGLIIPCAEMVRFYYANSSQMFHEIFTDGLAGFPNRLYNPENTRLPDKDGRNGFLRLSRHVKDVDAPVVARLAFDAYARSKAQQIYASLINADPLRDGRVFDAFFPFVNQKTKLRVHGTVLRSGNRFFFLVYWIESCSAPFPFEHFEYWRDNQGPPGQWQIIKQPDARRDFDRIPEPPPLPDDTFYYTVKDPNESFLQSDVSPSGARTPIELVVPQHKFPDLKRKLWTKRLEDSDSRFDDDNYKSGKKKFVRIKSNEEIETFSTAPQWGGAPVTPLSLVSDFENAGESQLFDDAEQDYVLAANPASATGDNAGGETPSNEPPSNFALEAEPFNHTPKKRRKRTALPASFRLFIEITENLQKLIPRATVQVIYIPAVGSYRYEQRSSVPPSYWMRKKRAHGEPLEAKPRQPLRIYAAEIRSELGERYAYLFDIHAKRSGSGLSERKFTMFLCYEQDQFSKFSFRLCREILERCEQNNVAWLRDDELIHLGRRKLKHASTSAKTYAKRIARELAANKWFE